MKLASQTILIAAMLATVARAVVLLFQRSSSDGAMEIVLPTVTSAPKVELKVHVSGAVRNPGVYAIHEGDRLSHVIEAAGGATADADLAAVNLAVRVKDEDHWQIPRVGEAPQESARQGTTTTGKIDINSAGVELLKTLPGIGEVKAQSIVRYRETNGPFASVEDLLDVRGIGPATLEALRDLVEAR